VTSENSWPRRKSASEPLTATRKARLTSGARCTPRRALRRTLRRRCGSRSKSRTPPSSSLTLNTWRTILIMKSSLSRSSRSPNARRKRAFVSRLNLWTESRHYSQTMRRRSYQGLKKARLPPKLKFRPMTPSKPRKQFSARHISQRPQLATRKVSSWTHMSP
jgi:hypothetical protein